MKPPNIENPPEINGLQANDLQEGDEAQNLSPRLDRYTRAKRRTLENLAYLDDNCQSSPHYPALSTALRSCGNYLLFHHYFTVGKVRLSKASFCKKHLLCPLCAIRRGAKALKAYLDRWQVIAQDNPELNLYLVTLTVKNGDDLEERFDHLTSSVKTLMRRRSRKNQPSETKKAAGGVFSYEVTNKGNGWHPHVHMIWACTEEPDQTRLQEEWSSITGDSFILDVRPFRADQDPAEGFSEVFKYAMKFSDLSVADNWTAADTLRGKRMVSSFGCFRCVVVPPELTDELLDDLPYIELLYRFRGGHYQYTPK